MSKKIISLCITVIMMITMPGTVIPQGVYAEYGDVFDSASEKNSIIINESNYENSIIENIDDVTNETSVNGYLTETIGTGDLNPDIEGVDSAGGLGEVSLFAANGNGHYIITATTLNVRSGPGAEYSDIGNLNSGDNAYVGKVDGNWGQINYRGNYEAWICLDYATWVGPLAPAGYEIGSSGTTMIAGEFVDIYYTELYNTACNATLVAYNNGNLVGNYDIGTQTTVNIGIKESGTWQFYLILTNSAGTFEGGLNNGCRTITVYNKITYDANGGNGAPSSQTKTYGKTLTLSSAKPTRSGYTFLGWSKSSTATSATYQAGGSFTANENTTLYAVWKKVETYTITYDANGGTGAPAAQTVTAGEYLTLSTTIPTRFGYRFSCWGYTADSTGGKTAGASAKFTESTTLYAVWSAPQSFVTTAYQIDSAYITYAGEYYYFTFTPSISGTYFFESTAGTGVDTYGCIYDSSGNQLAYNDDGGEDRNFEVSYSMTAGTKYYLAARYYSSSTTGSFGVKLSRGYTISYNANGGNGAPSSQIKKYGTDLTLSSTVPTRSGYTFLGWSASSTATTATYSAGEIFTSDANKTLYAVWKSNINTYTVTYNYSYNGGTSATKISASVVEGKVADLTPTATKSGWEFVGWNTSSTATTALSSHTVTGDTILYAIYKKTLTAKFYSASNSLQSTKTATIYNNATSGTVITPTPTSYSGWTVSGWRDDTTAGAYEYGNAATVSLSADKNFYAVYSRTLALSYNSNGGSSTPSSQTATQYYNAYGTKQNKSFTLASAISRKGYTFNGWAKGSTSGSCYSANDSISISDNTTMHATWTADIYTISYNANGGSGAPSSQKKTHGVPLTLSSTVPTRSGYTFLGWSASRTATTATYSAGDSFTSNIATTLYAVWSVDLKVATPIITVSNVAGGKSVTITTTTSGATIYYTTDGSTPTTNSSKYSSAIRFNTVETKTIKAVAVKSGYEDSTTVSKSITVSRASDVAASQNSGTITEEVSVTLSSATSGAAIYYTTDGSTPTISSTKYSGAINVGKTMSIKAIAVVNGYVNSNVVEFVYTFKETAVTPTPSPDVDISIEPLVELSSVVTNGSNIIVSGKIINEGNWDIKNVSCIIDCINSNGNSVTQEIAIKNDYSFADTLRWTNNESLLKVKALLVFEFNKKEYLIESNTQQCNISGEGLKNIEISPRSVNISPGEKTKLLISTNNIDVDFGEYSIKWDSANNTVAKIVKTEDDEIEIVANSVGRTRINASVYSKCKKVASTSAEVVVSDRYVPSDYDFSEWNMYKSSGTLNKTNGWDVNDGSAVKALGYLARWNGVIEEDDDSYEDLKSGQIDIDGKYHVQEAIFISPKANQKVGQEISKNEAYIRDMKSMLMTYGGIYASVYYDDRFFADSNPNYYFCPYKERNDGKKISANHAITIVGWDDNIVKEDFEVEGAIPGDDGAFICKNSYGMGNNDNGYFYISYDDVILGTTTSTVFNNVEAFNSDGYNKIYQYDYLGATAAVTLNANDKAVYCANVFTNNTSSEEVLKAVSTYVYNEGQRYNVYVIKDIGETVAERKKALADGLTFSNLKAGGTLEYMGYYTFDLDDEVVIKPGENFAVVIKLMSDKNAHFYIESRIQDAYGNISYSNANANDGESFVSRDGNDWMDCNSEIGFDGANVCVKAFTKTNSSEISVMSIETDEEVSLSAAEMVSGGLSTDITVGASSANRIKYNFPKTFDLRDDYVTDVKDQGNIPSCWAFATYGSMESCLKKKFTGIDKSKILEGAAQDEYLNLANRNVDVTGIVIDDKQKENAAIIAIGDTKGVNAYVLPSNATNQKIVWKSSNENIATVDASGNITGVSEGIVYITAADEKGQYSKKFAVSIEPATEDLHSVVLDSTVLRVQKEQSFFIDYVINPLNAVGYAIEIASDDTNVISVDDNGVLEAKELGTANIQIKAIAEDGTECAALCKVIVDDVNALELEIDKTSLSVYQEMTFGGVDIGVNNKTDDTIFADVYFACYDKDGVLLAVKQSAETLKSGENSTSFNNLSIDGVVKTIKVFAWGENLEPYATSLEMIIE